MVLALSVAGSVGGMLVATATGWLLQATGSYYTIFVLAGTAYLFALLVINALAPRLQQVEV